MRRLASVALLLLGLARLAAPLEAQQPGQRPVAAAILEGVWRLVAFEIPADSGRKLAIAGPPPHGFLSYTPSGHFFVQINSFFLEVAGSTAATPAAERGRVLVPQIAYFGTYFLNARDTLVHRVLGDVSGTYTGTDQPRPFRLSADSLILGDDLTWRRVFVRVKR
jgi:hypothetical protein